MIRLNPDVLIRSSSWLLRQLSNPTVEGIFVHCGPGTHQLHTDFFAVRPRVLLWNRTTNGIGTSTNTTAGSGNNHHLPRSNAFEHMTRVGRFLNHERTAMTEFRHLLQDPTKHRLVPNVDPSDGICRVRGIHAPVYHVHDSCYKEGDVPHDQAMQCSALEGWKDW